MIYISVKDRIGYIKSKIENEDTIILAVTKFVDYDLIDESIEAGIYHIGENRVDKLLERHEHYGDSLKYHMIGNLQTNKVKYLVGNVDLIHSLDRLSLLKEMERVGKNRNFVFNTLIQLNISKEASKKGIYLEDLDDFIAEVEKCKYVKVKGFMTMAPFTENEQLIEEVFASAKNIFEKHREIMYNNIKMQYLSMGMSNDFEIAIENKANILRIGSYIYKEGGV